MSNVEYTEETLDNIPVEKSITMVEHYMYGVCHKRSDFGTFNWSGCMYPSNMYSSFQEFKDSMIKMLTQSCPEGVTVRFKWFKIKVEG